MSSSRYTAAFREEIAQRLKHNREALSESSLKTYVSSLFNIARKMEAEPSLDFFDSHTNDIIKHISEVTESEQTQKSHLSALYVLTKNDAYRAKMLDLCQKVNEHYKSQRMTVRERENRVTSDAVSSRFAELQRQLEAEPTNENYVNVLMLGLMSGMFIPPRRNEYCSVKVANFDKDVDNWYNARKYTITFNRYKTYKKYGTQTVVIPVELRPTLKKWLKQNKTDWMFVKNNGEPFSSSDVSKRIKSIFGGKAVGADQLRSIYVTRNAPELAQLERDAEAMGHTLETHITYVRKT